MDGKAFNGLPIKILCAQNLVPIIKRTIMKIIKRPETSKPKQQAKGFLQLG